MLPARLVRGGRSVRAWLAKRQGTESFNPSEAYVPSAADSATQQKNCTSRKKTLKSERSNEPSGGGAPAAAGREKPELVFIVPPIVTKIQG